MKSPCRTTAKYRKNKVIFSQGDSSGSVFYVEEVVSDQSKEAVVAIHGKGDFFGEGCLTAPPKRLSTIAMKGTRQSRSAEMQLPRRDLLGDLHIVSNGLRGPHI